MQLSKAIILPLILITTVISCQQRYLGFKKVKAAPRRGSYKLLVQTNHNNYLNQEFITEVTNTTIHQLKKYGYTLTSDTPKYHFYLDISIDSSTASGYGFTREVWGYYYAYTRLDRSIKLAIWQSHAFNQKVIWQNHLEYYYFHQAGRDLRRAKNITRFLINTIEKE